MEYFKKINLKRLGGKSLIALYLQYGAIAGQARKKIRECEKEFERRKINKPRKIA